MIDNIILFCDNLDENEFIYKARTYYQYIITSCKNFKVEILKNDIFHHIDILIIEDDPADMVNIIKQIKKCNRIISVGICYKERLLLPLKTLIKFPPKAITLDYELSTNIDNYKEHKDILIQQLKDSIEQLSIEWADSKIIGISQHTDQEQMKIFNTLIQNNFMSQVNLKSNLGWENLGNYLINILESKESPDYGFIINGDSLTISFKVLNTQKRESTIINIGGKSGKPMLGFKYLKRILQTPDTQLYYNEIIDSQYLRQDLTSIANIDDRDERLKTMIDSKNIIKEEYEDYEVDDDVHMLKSTWDDTMVPIRNYGENEIENLNKDGLIAVKKLLSGYIEFCFTILDDVKYSSYAKNNKSWAFWLFNKVNEKIAKLEIHNKSTQSTKVELQAIKMRKNQRDGVKKAIESALNKILGKQSEVPHFINHLFESLLIEIVPDLKKVNGKLKHIKSAKGMHKYKAKIKRYPYLYKNNNIYWEFE